MPVVRPPEHPDSIELTRWDTPRSQGGMKPDGYEEFPVMLYRARELPNGQPAVRVYDDAIFPERTKEGDPILNRAEQWSESNHVHAKDERELQKYLEQGYRKTEKEALQAFEAKQQAIAEADARRRYDDRNLSPAARQEIAHLDDGTGIRHTPEIKEKPRARKLDKKAS